MADTRIAVVGLGRMGSGIARSLLAAGFPVTVYNRTRSKAEPLVASGATLADEAAQAGKDADVVVLSLSNESTIEEVLFAQMVPELEPGTVVVDTSTVSPLYARNTATRLAASGLRRVEACVVGNPQMAHAGQLRVFVSGEQSHVDAVSDVLEAFSQEVRYLGPSGQASAFKLALNLLLGVKTAALAEAVTFVERNGLERELLLDAIENSGWRSAVLSFRSQFMRDRSYEPPGFSARLMKKDLQLVLEEAEAGGFVLPVVQQTAQRFDAAILAGRGEEDAAVVAELDASLRVRPS